MLQRKGLLGEATDIVFDSEPVHRFYDARGNRIDFVPTHKAVCLDYPGYLPRMNEYFGDCDAAGMVTWHEGASAPPRILTVHSLGDVVSGVYGPADPQIMHNLLAALERQRVRLGMEDWSVVPEATHWSGMNETNDDATLLLQFPVPMVDIEIGSEPESWNDERAAEALAVALTETFVDDGLSLRRLLCVGGVHFDPSFADPVHTVFDGQAFGVSHILANQWLVSGEYENETGFERAKNAVLSIRGGVDAIAFHDKMKGCYKDLVRNLGSFLDVPIYKHQRLRNPDTLEWND